MNLDSLTFSLLRIKCLTERLSKKNYKQTNQELTQIINSHGYHAVNWVLRCLLTEAAKSWESERPGSSNSNNIHASLLSQHLTGLLNHPARVTLVCNTIDQPNKVIQRFLKPTNNLLNRLSRFLKFTTTEDVALSLVLKNSSKSDLATLAKQHLKRRFLNFVNCYLDADRGHQIERSGFQDCNPEVLHLLLCSLVEDSIHLAPVTKELFFKRLRSDFPREVVPIILSPLLYPDSTITPLKEMTTADDMSASMMDNSLADIIHEIGYAFTANVEECKNNMLNFGAHEPTASDVAKIISMMARYHMNVQDGPQIQTPGNFWVSHDANKEVSHGHCEAWNAEVFVQTLKELAPNLNWKEVILQLDHEEFIVPDRKGFFLLFNVIRLGLQCAGYPPNVFPVEYLFRRWTNLDGQMSLISNILKNHDIFSLADYAHCPLEIEILKAPPDIDNKQIATWRCFYLVELLLYAAERGFYLQVHEHFKFPIQHCPDILCLTLIKIKPPITILRQELFATLFPIFLGNHPNSGTILHHAWHSIIVNVKLIIMHSMVDWYGRGDNDQSKLSRILDVAQDFKALSLLLNMQSFPFIIDLACLASRREYLKLDKWLTDKIRDHGETFITAMITFLQRKYPQSMGKMPDELLKPPQLSHDTINTILACLQLCINSVQPELAEAICSLITNYQAFMLIKTRQTISGMAQPLPRVMETQFNPAGMSSQIFTPHAMDAMSSLSSNVANINLGAPPPNTAFAIPGTFGPLIAPSGSPQRLMGPNSPFTLMPIQHNANIANMGAIRMAPAPPIDKPRIPEQLHFPEMVYNISKEIEDEANGYFQRIYNHPPHPTLSIDEVLDMLKKFHDSPNKWERDVFQCMLRNLFEEYKFFPQYPDKELHITAQLFGGIIERGLVPNYVSLGLALRFVLDSLRKPDGTKMYYFGIAALDRFKSRLKDYHNYCEHVRALPHFNDFPPHLIEYIEYGLQSQEPPTKPQGSILPIGLPPILNPPIGNPVAAPYRAMVCPPSIAMPKVITAPGPLGSRPSIANATNIDTLLTATDKEQTIQSPPEAIQDKTAFIFNNLSQLNLQIKCEELKEVLTEEYYPWLSQYLVMKRASIELNFHVLYSNFLDVLKIRDVNTLVTKETYRNIKVLLQSDKSIANFSDRSLLKNLGHWLGMITLARNRPVLHVDIDVKGLLLEAYHKGQQELLYVVPFVAKVLESCAKSILFKPPNPWTMSLMNVLAELHQEPDLKLNLKFEIEVLCKNLSLEIGNLKPVIYLKHPDNIEQIEFQLSAPNKKETVSLPIDQIFMPTQMPLMQPQAPMMAIDELSTLIAPPLGGLIDPALMNVSLPPEPRFNYIELNVSSTATIAHKITFNSRLLLLQNYPHFKTYVRPAIERSIQEWIHPVVDRAIKYALPTCEHIIRKDFAMDPNDLRMYTCAHHLMRNLTAGMAMITCREQIVNTINTNLKTSFLAALGAVTSTQKELVDIAAAIIAAENMELASVYIQKSAVEKALPELDKRLFTDFEIRKLARQEGRGFFDSNVMTYQNERIPERVRLRLGGPSDSQLNVYEEFACNIPGFMPMRDVSMFIPKSSTQDAMPQLAFPPNINAAQWFGTEEMSGLITAVEMFLNNTMVMPPIPAIMPNMHSLMECLIIARRNRDPVSGCALLQKAVEGILEVQHLVGMSSEQVDCLNRYRDFNLRVLKLLQDVRIYGHVWTIKQITCCLTECREEIRYNLEPVDCLIKNHLVNLPQYDIALTHLMNNGNNYSAVTFAMQVVQFYLLEDRNNLYVTEADLYHTTDTLVRIASIPRQPPFDGLSNLIEMLRINQDPATYLGERAPLGPTSHIHLGMIQARIRENDDPTGLREKTEELLREWRKVLQSPLTENEITQNFNLFFYRMNMNVILKSDDVLTRFLRIATQMCIDNVYQLLNEDKVSPSVVQVNRDKYYNMCDAFIKLVSLLIKNTPDSGMVTSKLNLLNKVLGIIAGMIMKDHEVHGVAFHQLPYHRMLFILFLDMNMADPMLDVMSFQILTAFCHTIRIVRPSIAPGFCYAWLELMAHRAFVNKVLAVTPQQKGWGMYSTLLIDLFKYLNPFLHNTELAFPVMALYKGTVKILLVLLHDFPEFLCDYHYAFCNEISPNCIQLRNLILAAFPRSMRLPDPFTPNLKISLLTDIAVPPRTALNYSTLIPSQQFKKDLDDYLTARSPVTFLSELRSHIQISNEPGRRYNAELMNAVVLYVGNQAITYIRSKKQTPNMSTITHSAHMDIFQNFTVDLDHEGRYLFLNAVGNQLRYPNSHTHYFSCTLLYLFATANSEAVQEQITRMLLERLIVNRPHPWGLLVTFIELIKNSTYSFWSHDFVHCAPEIKKLFSSVARSCIIEKTALGSGERESAE